MSEFAESLVELEHTLRSARAAVAGHFRPGLEEFASRSQLDQVGLVPSDEVVEWFSWHNGAGDPNANLRNCELAPGVYIFDLETLCQEYLDTRRDFDAVTQDLPGQGSDSSDLWIPSWFPLARLDAGYVAQAAQWKGRPLLTEVSGSGNRGRRRGVERLSALSLTHHPPNRLAQLPRRVDARQETG